MSVNFQELDYSATPMGLLTLRRRKEITLGIDIYEIKLDEEFLMSSLFTVTEVALANLGLAELSEVGVGRQSVPGDGQCDGGIWHDVNDRAWGDGEV